MHSYANQYLITRLADELKRLTKHSFHLSELTLDTHLNLPEEITYLKTLENDYGIGFFHLGISTAARDNLSKATNIPVDNVLDEVTKNLTHLSHRPHHQFTLYHQFFTAQGTPTHYVDFEEPVERNCISFTVSSDELVIRISVKCNFFIELEETTDNESPITFTETDLFQRVHAIGDETLSKNVEETIPILTNALLHSKSLLVISNSPDGNELKKTIIATMEEALFFIENLCSWNETFDSVWVDSNGDIIHTLSQLNTPQKNT